jgi:putative DNA primase/helicase
MTQTADPIAQAFEQAIPVAPGDAGAPPPPDPSEPLEVHGATFPLNDYGNGQRLTHYYGRDIRYVPRLGWLRWDGRRWASDDDEIAVRRDAQSIAARVKIEAAHIALTEREAKALALWKPVAFEYRRLAAGRFDLDVEAKARLEELEKLRDEGEAAQKRLNSLKREHIGHAKATGNSGRIKNMLIEATTSLAINPDWLNANPLQFCCENGVLDFVFEKETFEEIKGWGEPQLVPRVRVLKHDRSQRISKIAAAAYNPAAPRPVFDAFLERILPDKELRDFMQRWFGYAMTGDTSEQKLAFLYGQGRNGKSTLIDVVALIMADYASTIPIETLTGSEQRKGSDATPDLVRLPGARFVRASEPEQGQKMKESLIKALTGGEAIMIRRMMQEFVEIVPQFKLTISGNYKPEVRGADDGIWRRIMLIPFLEQIPAEEVDRQLPRRLWEERDGILAWMVEGCLAWLRDGLNPPKVVADATREYRAESDPVRTFLETVCTITGRNTDKVIARELNDAFNGWMAANGQATWGVRATSNALRRRAESVRGPSGASFKVGKDNTTCYFGIALSEEGENWGLQYRCRDRD